MILIEEERLEQIKKQAKIFYEKINAVYCPYLRKEVRFNQEGFGHLLSKSWNRGRSLVEQYTRLRILPKVVDIIRYSYTVQEYDERKMFVRQKINSRWEKRVKDVKYFAFIAFLKEHNFRLKIVIKEIEGGQPYFWSVYPSWKVVKCIDGKQKKIFYTGNLEED